MTCKGPSKTPWWQRHTNSLTLCVIQWREGSKVSHHLHCHLQPHRCPAILHTRVTRHLQQGGAQVPGAAANPASCTAGGGAGAEGSIKQRRHGSLHDSMQCSGGQAAQGQQVGQREGLHLQYST
jgi:hypothetical protein